MIPCFLAYYYSTSVTITTELFTTTRRHTMKHILFVLYVVGCNTNVTMDDAEYMRPRIRDDSQDRTQKNPQEEPEEDSPPVFGEVEKDDGYESEAESESGAESESESEREIDSERVCESEGAEICDDESDNDCDGWTDCDDLDCAEIDTCKHCVELKDGWVRGAPTFALHEDTPTEDLEPGIRELMRISARAEDGTECAPVEITELSVLIWIPDDLWRSWRPRDAHVIDAQSGEMLLDWHDYEDWEEYRQFWFTEPLVLWPGEERVLSIWADVSEAIPGGDWIQAEITPDIWWRIHRSEDTTEYSRFVDILGEFMFF